MNLYLAVGLTLAVALILLVSTEFLWRRHLLRGEEARKFVHITGGTLLAFWPWFVSWTAIVISCLLVVIFVAAVHNRHIFKSIYDVRRRSWGDMLGPAMIGALAILKPDKRLFAVAVLHLALADGLAAVLGVRYGRGNRYRVFGQTKSLVGTAAFAVVSLAITAWLLNFHVLGLGGNDWWLLAALPLTAAVAENVAPFGSDNILVPAVVVTLLKLA